MELELGSWAPLLHGPGGQCPQPMAEGAEMKDVPVMKQMEDCARATPEQALERADRGQARAFRQRTF